MKHTNYIKDMLVAKFMARHKIQFSGPVAHDLKDIELRVQHLVTKEFEKFMDNKTFDQKHLDQFERDLKVRLEKTFGENGNLKIREVNGKPPASHRYLTDQSDKNLKGQIQK